MDAADKAKKDFFISYTGADAEIASWIAWILEEQTLSETGLKVYLKYLFSFLSVILSPKKSGEESKLNLIKHYGIVAYCNSQKTGFFIAFRMTIE
ncbi:MAG: hypothetical protein HGB15_07695 [Chlorobaculum sp.]|nr:hypothetical protein [Chlorobaculum sp.]